jgi:hypothetical protein
VATKKKRKRPAAKKPAVPKKPDIDNEDDVLREMAVALDMTELKPWDPEIDVSGLKIERDKNLESRGVSPVWSVYISPGHGQEYYVVADDSVADELALAEVRERLQDDPAEYFPAEFLERHINTEKLAKELRDDLLDHRREALKEADADEFWSNAENSSLVMYIPEEDEDGERRDQTPEEIEDLAEAQTDADLQDPMAYLADIYGAAEAAKEAIKIAGIDVDSAAAEIIRDDGAGPTLSGYDGETHETPGGFVYWRNN